MAFTLIRMVPGDPVLNLLGERGGTEEQVAEMKQKLGLDKSLPEQYFLFAKNALRGDLGISVISQRPVSEEFWGRFPATLELGLFSLTIAFLIGLPLGILAALKRNTFFDYGVMGFSTIGFSMPIFRRNKLPFPSSSSSGFVLVFSFFFLWSTKPLIEPPIAIGKVVDSGRYAPTAKLNDLIPHNSITMARKTPTKTYCQSKLKERIPLIKVAIKVACGAGYFSVPIAWLIPCAIISALGLSKYFMVIPITIEDTIAPTNKAIC